MQARCPECQHSIHIATGDSISSLECTVCGSTFSLSSDAETVEFRPHHDTIGRFELQTRLGRGSFGIVYKARDTELERIVALKIPRRDRLSAEECERFLHEAQAVAQLNHPNIVSVHEVGRDEGAVFIVSDFIDGVTLADWLTARQLKDREAVELLIKIVRALAHAHRAGIIHRDLKPSNVMLDADGEPYIMDFGVAKRVTADASMTADGDILGTPAYMAPELARGEGRAVDGRTDLYSVGVMLFEMLTGERPFRGNVQMVLHQVLHDEPPAPQQLNASISTDLNTICLKCLERIPEKRFANADELVEELQRFLEGRPIKTRAISSGERFWRLCKRNPQISILACTLLIVLVTGLVGVTTQWLRADFNAAQADAEAERANEESANAQQAASEELAARKRTQDYLYVAHMNLVQQAYELSDPARAISLLNRHRESAGQDRRSFEWYYWWALCHRHEHILSAHEGSVFAVALSPDARLVATGGVDELVRVWDVETGTLQAELPGHDGFVYSAAFSPDGQLLATGGRDRVVRLWNPADGTAVAELQGHESSVFTLAFSSDSQTLISGSADQTVRVWDIASRESRQVLQGHSDFVYSVDVYGSGRQLIVASGSLDRRVLVWDLERPTDYREFSGHEIEVWSVAFSPDGQRLASGSGDGSIALWQVDTGKRLARIEGHYDRVRAVRFLPDGQTLISTGNDRTVRIWDLTRIEAKEFVPKPGGRDTFFFERRDDPEIGRVLAIAKGHRAAVNALATSAAGDWVATASDDGDVRLWKTDRIQERLVRTEHERSVNSVVFVEGGQRFISGSSDHTVRIWSTESGAPIGEPLVHGDYVYAVDCSSTGRIASGGRDQVVKVWSLEGRHLVFELQGHERSVSAVAFSRDGQRLASGSHDRSIRIWSMQTGELLYRVVAHDQAIQSLVFTTDGRLISGSRDGRVGIHDFSRDEPQSEFLDHGAAVWSVALSPDEARIASGGEANRIREWDLDKRALLQTMTGHGDRILALDYAPDGRSLASASSDTTVMLWDVATGESKATLKGHRHRVWTLAFSPDNQTLVSGSYYLRLWRGPKRQDQ